MLEYEPINIYRQITFYSIILMVKLRLTRTGKKHEPHYRIVATDSRSPRDGKFIEILGHYNPRTKPSTFVVKKDLVEKWLKNGAQVSDTLKALLKKEGLYKDPVKKESKRVKKISKMPQSGTPKQSKSSKGSGKQSKVKKVSKK